MKIETLADLFREQLKDMYYAERRILKALVDMADKATDAKLKDSFEKHHRETQDQIAKLETVMQSLDMKVEGEKCQATDGLLKEADELIRSAKDPEVLDAVLILAAQKVEHYEVATYGCLCAFANRLGHQQQAKILHGILEQERETDAVLTRLAEVSPQINQRAAA